MIFPFSLRNYSLPFQQSILNHSQKSRQIFKIMQGNNRNLKFCNKLNPKEVKLAETIIDNEKKRKKEEIAHRSKNKPKQT